MKTENTETTATYTEDTNQKLGIIFSAKPGGKRRWKRVLQYLKQQNTDFDYVKSETSADVERLTAMMVKNGYAYIVIVGGDSALNYAINGIMKTTSPSGKHPVLGVFPGGYGNDFARYWGIESSDYRRTINGLLHRRTRRIDVGRAVITTGTAAQTEYFINCVNIGIAASIMNLRRKTKSFLGTRLLSYLVSSLLLLFKKMSYSLVFTTGGEQFEHRAMTLCIGSGRGYGQTPSAVPYNGLLDMSLVSTSQAPQLLHGLWLLLTGRFLSHKGIRVWRTRSVTFTALGGAPLSIDGRYIQGKADTIKADIMKEEIEFLIIGK